MEQLKLSLAEARQPRTIPAAASDLDVAKLKEQQAAAQRAFNMGIADCHKCGTFESLAAISR